MNELMIFDLQRFALHDGPGIRTTVFLKGCPLDCIWCHNPESKNRKPQLGFREKQCIYCGKCQVVCPINVHQVDGEGEHKIDFENCIQCGKCVEACAPKALKIFGENISIQEIMNVVKKDKDYYNRSGGGLTVSGGEPMLQFEGLLELLKQAKKEGIHTCLDTSGYASTKRYLEIAEYVDLFLFDYKMTDPMEHKRYIGVDNELIIANLEALCKQNNKMILRCPIIPGMNDNEKHYRAITEYSQRYEAIEQVNLMVYHDMAKGKVAQIGETYELSGIATVNEEEKKEIYNQVKACGCLRLKEG